MPFSVDLFHPYRSFAVHTQ